VVHEPGMLQQLVFRHAEVGVGVREAKLLVLGSGFILCFCPANPDLKNGKLRHVNHFFPPFVPLRDICVSELAAQIFICVGKAIGTISSFSCVKGILVGFLVGDFCEGVKATN